jgi:xanthine dehydrogenase YagS FAD-binding subunit
LGGIATKPWRAAEAELFLMGRKASEETFRDAADIALTWAVGRHHNHFQIELAERVIVHAFATVRDSRL